MLKFYLKDKHFLYPKKVKGHNYRTFNPHKLLNDLFSNQYTV